MISKGFSALGGGPVRLDVRLAPPPFFLLGLAILGPTQRFDTIILAHKHYTPTNAILEGIIRVFDFYFSLRVVEYTRMRPNQPVL